MVFSTTRLSDMTLFAVAKRNLQGRPNGEWGARGEMSLRGVGRNEPWAGDTNGRIAVPVKRGLPNGLKLLAPGALSRGEYAESRARAQRPRRRGATV